MDKDICEVVDRLSNIIEDDVEDINIGIELVKMKAYDVYRINFSDMNPSFFKINPKILNSVKGEKYKSYSALITFEPTKQIIGLLINIYKRIQKEGNFTKDNASIEFSERVNEDGILKWDLKVYAKIICVLGDLSNVEIDITNLLNDKITEMKGDKKEKKDETTIFRELAGSLDQFWRIVKDSDYDAYLYPHNISFKDKTTIKIKFIIKIETRPKIDGNNTSDFEAGQFLIRNNVLDLRKDILKVSTICSKPDSYVLTLIDDEEILANYSDVYKISVDTVKNFKKLNRSGKDSWIEYLNEIAHNK